MSVAVGMASSFHSPLSGHLARAVSSVLLLLALVLSYHIVRTEVEASSNPTPTKAVPSPEALPREAEVDESEAQPGKRLKREGSRREWLERRQRRWFTPPQSHMDRGLPKARGRFKVA